eukprot:CAMPEP_0179024450 /NCGR_PEP_ID=MMETSP0796-20121207/7459_1 /TAXON_ID=73915 /ORGANISM="Pyrodinium bahamense, Strain pbaha01" /LENGTH=35 /DNA_ID= /DNA_START= /DNA_END= /DNA_ORIENTATION=
MMRGNEAREANNHVAEDSSQLKLFGPKWLEPKWLE